MYYIIELLDNTDKTICQKAVKQNTLNEWSEQALTLAAKHGVKSIRYNVLCWTGCKYEYVQSFRLSEEICQEDVDKGLVQELHFTY